MRLHALALSRLIFSQFDTAPKRRLNGLDDDEVRNVESEVRRNVTKSAVDELMSGLAAASEGGAADDND